MATDTEHPAEKDAPDTGWHRHDNGLVHRDTDACTWLGNPVPCGPPTRVIPPEGTDCGY